MDKEFVGGDSSSAASSAATSNSNSTTNSSREMLLKQVNKNSHKIAKPIRKPLPPQPVASSSPIPLIDPIPPQSQSQSQSQSQQPPVYNINKNDFRDVVQKLTGSPAHDRFPTPPPPPVSQTRPPSSRLQRIRPPPLAQIANRPLSDLGQRGPPAVQPFTPLPPLPSVHTAAESPISAYMRFLQTSCSAGASSMWSGAPTIGPLSDSLLPQKDVSEQVAQPRPIAPLPPVESPISTYMRFLQSSVYPLSAASPRWESGAPPPPAQQPPLFQQQQPPPPPPPIPSSASSPSPFPVFPLSSLPFGCIPSPRSQYGMLSPSLLLSPSGQFGLPPLPLSPNLPVPSPRWKGM